MTQSYALHVAIEQANSPFFIEPRCLVDESGSLTVFEESALPHAVHRAFLVSSRRGQRRGGHAHRRCWQTLYAVSGRVLVETISQKGTGSFTLRPQSMGLVVPPMIWATQQYRGLHPQLLVLCSHPYDENDYIHSLRAFEDLLKD